MSAKRKRGDAASTPASDEDTVVTFLRTKSEPVSQQQLQTATGLKPEELVQVLSALLKEHRVKIYTSSAGTSWKLIGEDQAAKLAALSLEERLVLGLIEKAGSQAIWLRNLKLQAKLSPVVLVKILKRLEKQRLIRTIRTVAVKNRKMYILEGVEPAKELTGGVWFNDAAMDRERIEAIRAAAIQILQARGGSATPRIVADEIRRRGLSAVPLSPSDVRQLLDTLVADATLDVAGSSALRHARYSRGYRARFYVPPADDEAIEAPAPRSRRGGGPKVAYEEDDDGDEEEDDEGEDEGDEDEREYTLVSKSADWNNLTTVPCGVCPVFDQCVPGGVIAPETCAYFSKWLLF